MDANSFFSGTSATFVICESEFYGFRIMEKDEKGWVIQAEVFGDGIEMWLRSQGNRIELFPVKV
jgi:hypothetical protein